MLSKSEINVSTNFDNEHIVTTPVHMQLVRNTRALTDRDKLCKNNLLKKIIYYLKITYDVLREEERIADLDDYKYCISYMKSVGLILPYRPNCYIA